MIRIIAIVFGALISLAFLSIFVTANAAELVRVDPVSEPVIVKTMFPCEGPGSSFGLQKIKARTQQVVYVYANGTVRQGTWTEKLKVLSGCEPIGYGPWATAPGMIPAQ